MELNLNHLFTVSNGFMCPADEVLFTGSLRVYELCCNKELLVGDYKSRDELSGMINRLIMRRQPRDCINMSYSLLRQILKILSGYLHLLPNLPKYFDVDLHDQKLYGILEGAILRERAVAFLAPTQLALASPDVGEATLRHAAAMSSSDRPVTKRLAKLPASAVQIIIGYTLQR